MSTQSKTAFAVGLGLIALAAVFLIRLQAFQKLGVPGVRVVPHAVYREDDARYGTNVLVGTNAVDLPERVLNFSSKELRQAKVVTDWLPPDTTYGQRLYESPDGFWILVNAVLMGSDRTSIHKPEYCLQGQGFTVKSVEQVEVPIRLPHAYGLPVQKWTVHRDVVLENRTTARQSALYVFWFVADQQLTAQHNERMWWMARDMVIKGTLQRWAYISCFAVCAPGEEDATYARMQAWISEAVPRFQLATRPAGALASHR
jgi:Protein of unknown function (DUF3485)